MVEPSKQRTKGNNMSYKQRVLLYHLDDAVKFDGIVPDKLDLKKFNIMSSFVFDSDKHYLEILDEVYALTKPIRKMTFGDVILIDDGNVNFYLATESEVAGKVAMICYDSKFKKCD